MPMPRGTGFANADAQEDFLRAHRRHALSRLGRRMARAGDFDAILPFDEVVAALGRTGERDLGAQSIAPDSIVGTVVACERYRLMHTLDWSQDILAPLREHRDRRG